MSCFWAVGRRLNASITRFASEPALRCAKIAWSRSLVRPSCRKKARWPTPHSGALLVDGELEPRLLQVEHDELEILWRDALRFGDACQLDRYSTLLLGKEKERAKGVAGLLSNHP